MKNQKNNATPATSNNNGGLTFIDADKITANREVTDKYTKYVLYNGIELVIINSDKDYDFGSLRLFGVKINVTFRQTKNGFRMLYPSYKTNGNEYKDHAISYNKDLNALINTILEYHYNSLTT